MAQQSGLASTCSQLNFTQWLLPNLTADSRPEAICVLPAEKHIVHQSKSQGLHILRWDVQLMEAKFCDDTPEQQLARATKQHTRLKCTLAQQYYCHKVSPHTILIG